MATVTTAPPAVVTIQQLTTGTSLTGAELFEAVQTSAGQANSMQVALNTVANFVLGTSGPFGAIPGLSVLGVPGTAAASAIAITGTGAQVLRVSDNGSTLGFGQVELASAAAVTGVLPTAYGGTNQGANYTAEGIVYATSSTQLAATNFGTTAWIFSGNGSALAPAFQQVNLASAGVTGVLPVGNGGQGTSTLTAHAVLLGEGGATLGFAAIGTGGNLLIDQGSGNDPAFKTIVQDLSVASTGSATVTGLQARTLLSTAPATNQVVGWSGAAWLPQSVVTALGGVNGSVGVANGIDMSGNNIEITAARRTLPTVQLFTTVGNATYTTAANVLWVEVLLVGGGASGASGGSSQNAGSAGGTTTLGTAGANQLIAGGGFAPTNYNAAASFATGVLGTATGGFVVRGNNAGAGFFQLINAPGGAGGGSFFGGAGGGGPAQAGVAAAANTGGGGGGGGTGGAATPSAGAGGNAGTMVWAVIDTPAASYPLTVGAGGALAAAVNATGFASGTGGSGQIMVIEHYGT